MTCYYSRRYAPNSAHGGAAVHSARRDSFQKVRLSGPVTCVMSREASRLRGVLLSERQGRLRVTIASHWRGSRMRISHARGALVVAAILAAVILAAGPAT